MKIKKHIMFITVLSILINLVSFSAFAEEMVITETKSTIPTGAYTLAYGNGQYVAVESNGTVLTSTDG
ncbi:hypothetical protein, partial [Dethiothermospora halolimnae]|uniref:hypothetical protein n=1 Tax=Dethiothermospora halolimnae TaxID=3114390 RepID=UPI003CCBE453